MEGRLSAGVVVKRGESTVVSGGGRPSFKHGALLGCKFMSARCLCVDLFSHFYFDCQRKGKTCPSEVNISNQIYGLSTRFRISLPLLTLIPTPKAL